MSIKQSLISSVEKRTLTCMGEKAAMRRERGFIINIRDYDKLVSESIRAISRMNIAQLCVVWVCIPSIKYTK